MNLDLYHDWIERTCSRRRVSLVAALPKLLTVASEILAISSAGGTVYTLGDETASQSLANYLATELRATKSATSGISLRAMSVFVPNLLAYDDPGKELATSLDALVGPSDALLVFQSSSDGGFLAPVLENLKRRPAYQSFIGFHRSSKFALWSEKDFSLGEVTPREHVELQQAAVNLLLLLVTDPTTDPHGAPAS